MQCEGSPCAGYSGCNTIQNYEQRKSCMKNNCFCDIGPEQKPDLTATEPPACISCGKYNQCETNKSLRERQDCLSKNCGFNCKNQMDTFPPLPVEPFLYFPRTRIR
jgi:hypothetical protein